MPTGSGQLTDHDDGPQSNIARRRAVARTEGGAAYQRRRAEILDASAAVFKQHGFRGTTISHIAEALGTDRASLYYYVASKEEIFEEIVTDAVRANIERAETIRDGGGSGAERLGALVRSLTESYEEFYPVLYVLLQENLNHVAPERGAWAEEMRQAIRTWEGILHELVRSGQADGSIRDDSPPWVIAYGVVGAVSWSYRWFNPARTTLSGAELGDTFARLLLDGLATRPA